MTYTLPSPLAAWRRSRLRAWLRRWVEVAVPSHSWFAATLTRFPCAERATLCLAFLRVGIYLKVPCPPFLRGDPSDDPSYGAYLGEEALVISHGNDSTFLYYPWSLDYHARWEERELDCYGKTKRFWVHVPREAEHGSLATAETHPFTYTLRSGEKQEVTATIYRNRMTWRRRWLPFTDLFSRTRESIDVEFSEGVGEKVGTWKGGVLGTGFGVRPGESNEQALRRMEREWRA